MKLVRQAQHNDCGFAAAAMLCGVSLSEVLLRSGESPKKTSMRHVRAMCELFGYTLGKCQRITEDVCPVGVVGLVQVQWVEWRTGLSHWVVWDGRQFLDPSGERYECMPHHRAMKFYPREEL